MELREECSETFARVIEWVYRSQVTDLKTSAARKITSEDEAAEEWTKSIWLFLQAEMFCINELANQTMDRIQVLLSIEIPEAVSGSFCLSRSTHALYIIGEL